MKINPVNGWSKNFSSYENSPADYSQTFAKVLDNVKHGKPATADDSTQNQDTMVMRQVLSDGSTLITVYDEDGHVISQSKTPAVKPDSSPQVLDTQTEYHFGLDELANFNLIL